MGSSHIYESATLAVEKNALFTTALFTILTAADGSAIFAR